MLRAHIYRYKRPLKYWPLTKWTRWLVIVLIGLLFISGIAYAVNQGSSRQFVRLLLEQSFPFELFLLEGAPGYSQPERERLGEIRTQGLSLGTFLLTGVNISDPRTFFLSYFAPPPQGPAWLGWAYQPGDPEFEGPILEPDEQPPLVSEPDTSPVIPPAGNQKVLVGIYHTHNAESYAGDGGPERNQGKNGDIVAVGDTLTKALTKYGIGAVHSTQIHDGTDFMKAYSESGKTGSKLLKTYPTIKILLDIHRDGLPPGVSKSTVNIQEKQASQVLIVIGKKHPNWQANEKLAKELIAIGEQKYPGLFEPNISYAADARYNQHLSSGALLLEFGSQLNTAAEAKAAAEAVAVVLTEWLKAHP